MMPLPSGSTDFVAGGAASAVGSGASIVAMTRMERMGVSYCSASTRMTTTHTASASSTM